jgi:hypothetical protein
MCPSCSTHVKTTSPRINLPAFLPRPPPKKNNQWRVLADARTQPHPASALAPAPLSSTRARKSSHLRSRTNAAGHACAFPPFPRSPRGLPTDPAAPPCDAGGPRLASVAGGGGEVPTPSAAGSGGAAGMRGGSVGGGADPAGSSAGSGDAAGGDGAGDLGSQGGRLVSPSSSRRAGGRRVAYEVTTLTSDIRGAGTDCGVTAVLVGAGGESGEVPLENHPDNFARGRLDTFVVMSPVVRHHRCWLALFCIWIILPRRSVCMRASVQKAFFVGRRAATISRDRLALAGSLPCNADQQARNIPTPRPPRPRISAPSSSCASATTRGGRGRGGTWRARPSKRSRAGRRRRRRAAGRRARGRPTSPAVSGGPLSFLYIEGWCSWLVGWVGWWVCGLGRTGE